MNFSSSVFLGKKVFLCCQCVSYYYKEQDYYLRLPVQRLQPLLDSVALGVSPAPICNDPYQPLTCIRSKVRFLPVNRSANLCWLGRVKSVPLGMPLRFPSCNFYEPVGERRRHPMTVTTQVWFPPLLCTCMDIGLVVCVFSPCTQILRLTGPCVVFGPVTVMCKVLICVHDWNHIHTDTQLQQTIILTDDCKY